MAPGIQYATDQKVNLTNYETRESGVFFFTTARQYHVWRRLHANYLVVTKKYQMCVYKQNFYHPAELIISLFTWYFIKWLVFLSLLVSSLLYGCEACSLSSVMMKKLDAFETWLYRKMLRI